MSKASVAKKIATKLANKADDSAEAILARVDTPEKALALSGPEKQKYLDALDSVYGPREKRSKDLGFGDQTYYHGTKSDIKEIDPSKFGKSTKAKSAKDAFFATSNPEVADRFGHIAPVKEQVEADALWAKYDDMLQNGVPEDDEEMIDLAKQWNRARKAASALGTGGRLTAEQASIYPVKLKTPKHVVDRGGGDIWGDQYETGKIKRGTNLYKNAVDDPNRRKPTPSDIIATTDPSAVRSTNAAFDPRFKDSPNILSATQRPAPEVGPLSGLKDIAGKISNKLMQAYQGSTLEKADTLREQAVQGAVNRMDLYKGVTGLPDQQFQDTAGLALDMALPGTLDALPVAGVVSKVAKAAKAGKKADNVLGMAAKALPNTAQVDAAKALGTDNMLKSAPPRLVPRSIAGPVRTADAADLRLNSQLPGQPVFNKGPQDHGKVLDETGAKKQGIIHNIRSGVNRKSFEEPTDAKVIGYINRKP